MVISLRGVIVINYSEKDEKSERDKLSFDEEFEQPKDSLLFKAKNSYCGWHYLKNAMSMVDFTRRRK